VDSRGYVPKLGWDAAAARWVAADLRAESGEPMPWPGWLDAADFPVPRYAPAQQVRCRVGGRWRDGKVVSVSMSGGNRMQAEGEDLRRLSYAWGHAGEVQYVIEGQTGEVYRDVPELRVREANV
jgi:hypothetical protein